MRSDALSLLRRMIVLVMEDWATVDGGGPAAPRAGRVAQTGMMGGMMEAGMMNVARIDSGTGRP